MFHGCRRERSTHHHGLCLPQYKNHALHTLPMLLHSRYHTLHITMICCLLVRLPSTVAFGVSSLRRVGTSFQKLSTTSTRTHVAGDENGTTDVTGESLTSDDIPIYKCEGLFAIEKPLEWTSNDCVSHLRGILERDAKNRGAPVANFRSRGNKSRKVKVGHGGTLDPLATGVLVIGVGKGTKELQEYVYAVYSAVL